MTTPAKPLTADEIADLLAKAKAATPGPYFVAEDEALDCPAHHGSGLALVDTGRESDWPIARLCEWKQARYIAAANPETIQRAIATIEQQAEQIEKLLTKWQPIETAPMKMRVLIWVEDDEPDHILAWTNDSGEMDEWPIGTTHWQLLPSGPDEARAATEQKPC